MLTLASLLVRGDQELNPHNDTERVPVDPKAETLYLTAGGPKTWRAMSQREKFHFPSTPGCSGDTQHLRGHGQANSALCSKSAQVTIPASPFTSS